MLDGSAFQVELVDSRGCSCKNGLAVRCERKRLDGASGPPANGSQASHRAGGQRITVAVEKHSGFVRLFFLALGCFFGRRFAVGSRRSHRSDASGKHASHQQQGKNELHSMHGRALDPRFRHRHDFAGQAALRRVWVGRKK